MGHVYGDSTPFPHNVNFIEQIRQVVDCGVAIMRASELIRDAKAASLTVDSARKAERARMNALSDALKLTMTAFSSASAERVARAANRILDAARSVLDGELASLENEVIDTQQHGKHAIERSREETYRAMEAFALNHDLPATEVSLRLLAAEEVYSGQVVVQTPFGLEAIFSLQIPSAHQWGKPRRVMELAGSTEVHLPAETGLFTKKVTLQPFKLDKYFIAEIARSTEKAIVLLRKAPRSGGGYELEIFPNQHTVLLRRLGEDGQPEPTSEVIELSGEDLVHAERLWGRIAETTADLAERRQTMSSATFDGKNLRDLEEPKDILARLIAVVAPVVREIAKRSGAPGELVLRRDSGSGRREEIYITKAELHEKVMSLAPAARAIFDPLELSDGPRSPRAPAHSEPIVIEAGENTNPGIELPGPLDLDAEVTKSK
jgi:hypothetical protein